MAVCTDMYGLPNTSDSAGPPLAPQPCALKRCNGHAKLRFGQPMKIRAGAAFTRNLHSAPGGFETVSAHMSHSFQDSEENSAPARASRRFPPYGSFGLLWTKRASPLRGMRCPGHHAAPPGAKLSGGVEAVFGEPVAQRGARHSEQPSRLALVEPAALERLLEKRALDFLE